MPSKSWKKPPSKVAQKNSNPLFFLLPWAAQMAQTEEFMFQNVAYRPTVYRTGICSLWTRICPQWFISKLSLSKQDEVFNSKKSNFFLLKVKEFEILHCIQPSVIRTADHEWVLQEAKFMKHRTKKYTRYSFRKEFTTVLEKSPETTSNALLGTQWGQK